MNQMEDGKRSQEQMAKRMKGMTMDQRQAAMKKLYLGMMRQAVGEGMSDEEFAKHFTPSYNPWEQRVCFCPDNDFYECIKRGEASVATDEIECFDETGILLKSGEHLEADIIVTATGLLLQENAPMNTMAVSVDGAPYVAADHICYLDCMLTDVPNFIFVTGYFQASWTLKADLIASCEFTSNLPLLVISV